MGRKMLNNRVLIKLNSSMETLSSGVNMKREVSSGRELLKGVVLEAPAGAALDKGDVIVFPKWSANDCGIVGEGVVTVNYKDIEWVEYE